MLTAVRRALPSLRALWTRIGVRASIQQTTRIEVLQTILTEGLDTWDRLDAGKRRPRKTRMRRTAPLTYLAPNTPESIQ
jgi:hypothetical protein